MSSGQGLLDAPEEAHGKDHEEELQRKERVIWSQTGCTSRGYPANHPERNPGQASAHQLGKKGPLESKSSV